MKTLFVGDINVDLMLGGMQSPPMTDREVVCRTFKVTMGSSTVIAACAYAALGGKASFIGLAGKDDYGKFMLNGLRKAGVDIRLVRRTGTVKTGVTVNMIHSRSRTQVTYPGTIAEFRGWNITERYLRGFGHVHFAGPYLQTKLRPHITRLLRLARRMGLSTSLDPQWDPTEKWEFMHMWLPLLTYFFPNGDEARSITHTTSMEKACAILSSLTACPVIKAGKHGAIAHIDGKIRSLPTPWVKVVDTTGAGDSFNAGFLFAVLEKKMPLLNAVRFANATGARSCKFAGGTAARSTYRDVVQLVEKSA